MGREEDRRPVLEEQTSEAGFSPLCAHFSGTTCCPSLWRLLAGEGRGICAAHSRLDPGSLPKKMAWYPGALWSPGPSGPTLPLLDTHVVRDVHQQILRHVVTFQQP